MIRISVTLALLGLSLASCTGYKNSFDCPPQPGIGCKSVSYIESRIIEREEGPDEFVLTEEKKKAKPCKNRCKTVAYSQTRYEQKIPPRELEQRRIWVVGAGETPGHYVYFDEAQQ